MIPALLRGGQMRITALTLSYVHVRRIGAEVALHALLTKLVDRGHEVNVRTMLDVKPATVDGISVEHYTGNHAAGDLAITNSGLANRVRRIYHGVPLLIWAHNNRRTSLEDLDAARRIGNVTLLTNTHHMADVYLSVLGIRSLVLHPPITPGSPQPPGEAVTMINLNRDKGATVFWNLAAAHLEQPFTAVRGGHGVQDLRAMTNVTIIEHGDLEPIWARTRTLLLPSLHESYSMVAVEAASRGIPTLATDLPGVREALGAGAYYVDNDDWAGGLAAIEAGWDTYSKAAVTHSHTVDSPAELNAACDLAEQITWEQNAQPTSPKPSRQGQGDHPLPLSP